jgi:hypothetical protein
MQRSKSSSLAAFAVVAPTAEISVLKANVVPKARTTRRKRRIYVQVGKDCVLAIDQHTILRISIGLVASICCFAACQSLLNEVKGVVEVQAPEPQSIRQRPRNQQEERMSKVDLAKGKDRIIQLLKEAGIIDLDDDTLSRLPTWDEVM